MQRIYNQVIKDHINDYKQMAFIEGPRQVGKTTITKLLSCNHYLNWDDDSVKELLLSGQRNTASYLGMDSPDKLKSIIAFDELHKYSKWKGFLKGFYDLYADQTNIIMTGSSKLGIYKRGGDSLMGRYFVYRIHPFSVAEITQNFEFNNSDIKLPQKISNAEFENLLQFGGFPDPYLKSSERFSNKWAETHFASLFKEDIRELTQIHELSQIELLGKFLISQSGSLTSMSSLAKKVKTSIPTISRWLSTLEAFFYSYRIYPWSNNIPRSLIKEPKIYLWDWSVIEDKGAKFENLVASHLLKFTHFYTDIGLGKYGLYFVRDKQKKEVDFLVVKNNKPWMLVEAKTSHSERLSNNLAYFQEKLGCPFAFQVVRDMEYREINCFDYNKPVIVPASTFLSQLV